MKNCIKYLMITILMLSQTALWAQPAAASESTGMFSSMTLVLIFVGLLICIALLVSNLLQVFVTKERYRLLEQKGVDIEALEAEESKTFFDKWQENVWNVVPIDKEKEIISDHGYDGIFELDNSLPPWWVALFYITIVYGVLHIGYTHFSPYGVSQLEEYERSMEKAEKEVALARAMSGSSIDETNAELLSDDADLAAGKEVFLTTCATCHGKLGEGGVGPNFTDEYWVHGGDIKDLFKVVKYGVPEKGMISWAKQLRPKTIQQVSSYILSLQGTNPPNGKEPEGELYKPEQ